MAMVTLFQLFTLDKWHSLLFILSEGMDSMVVPVIFVLLWVLLGSFIFRNIFVGVMGKLLVANLKNDLYRNVTLACTVISDLRYYLASTKLILFYFQCQLVCIYCVV